MIDHESINQIEKFNHCRSHIMLKIPQPSDAFMIYLPALHTPNLPAGTRVYRTGKQIHNAHQDT